MKTAAENIKEYTMQELMSTFDFNERNMYVRVTFEQSEGYSHQFLLQGGFAIKGAKAESLDLYAELRETGVSEDLITHYSVIWDYFQFVMSRNYDFSLSNVVTIGMRHNPKMSANSHASIMKYTNDYPREGRFTTDISKRVFYDFVVVANDEEVIKVTGIPHFAVPAVMRYIGKWLQLAEATLPVVA